MIPALSKSLAEAVPFEGRLDMIKAVYRPYICPFDDLLGEIREGDRVADIGCGQGTFLFLAGRFSKARSLYGIDIDTRAIERARSFFATTPTDAPVTVHAFDGKKIPDEIGSCSVVFMIDVLHHIPVEQRPDFFSQLYSKMAPGSRLVLKDIDAGHRFLVLFNKLHDLVLTGAPGQELSSRATKQMLESMGFSVTKQSYRRMIFYPHFTVCCEKPA